MIPVNRLTTEHESDYYSKNCKGDNFLNYFELHKVERAAVAGETDSVGRNGEAVFEEGDTPRKQDHQNERPAGGNLHFIQFQMPLPGECHKDVGEHQHQNCPNSLHFVENFGEFTHFIVKI